MHRFNDRVAFVIGRWFAPRNRHAGCSPPTYVPAAQRLDQTLALAADRDVRLRSGWRRSITMARLR